MATKTNAKRPLLSRRFPRASRYNPEWVLAGVSGGANPLWLTEWLTETLELKPGMRVLDLGCGRALSSIFLRHEFGVQVWAADLWFSAAENLQRVRDAGLDDGVFPIHADARSLPFPESFFDAIISIDSFVYYGTDEHYLNYLARFLKPDGWLGIAGAGIMREIDVPIPKHLRSWWTPELWCLHSAVWWRQHWERTGIVDIKVADHLSGGWQRWLEWQHFVSPDNTVEIKALEVDRGKYLGYVRVVARRLPATDLSEPIVSVPTHYTHKALLRPGL